MSIYMRTRTPSVVSRMHAANAERDARLADKADIGNQLKRRLRAEMMGQSGAAAFAAGEWQKLNDSIPAPVACGRGKVHPQRAEALAQFVADQGWSDNPAEPIVPTQTLAEAVEVGTAEARERLAAAKRAYEEYEDERRGIAVEKPEPAETAVIEPVKRPRGRPPGPRVSIDHSANDVDLPVNV